MRSTLLAAALIAVAAPALAQSQPPATPAPPPPPPAPYGMPIAYDVARTAVDAALAEARRNGWKVAITVVEPSGEIVAFAKDEGTGYAAVPVSMDKARTAARFARETRAFGLSTERLWPLVVDGMVPIEGGVPIVIGGRTVGAIGVSGASASQDGQVARAGAEAAARS